MNALTDDVEKLILKLKRYNIRIDAADGRLKVALPEGISVPEILREIRDYKQQLIDYIGKATTKMEPVPLRHQEFYDASALQKAAILGYVYSLERGSFNMNRYFDFPYLDVLALKKAFGALVRRHECLRSTIVFNNGDIKQKVNAFEPAAIGLKYVDARGQNVGEVTASLFREIDNDHQPIDPARGPCIDLMIKTRLIQTTDKDYIFLFSVPHIICDAWSVRILQTEFFALYEAYARGEEPALAASTLQLKDHVAWMNEMLHGTAGEKMRNYWHGQWKDLPGENLCRIFGYHQPYNGGTYQETLREEMREVYKPMSDEEQARFWGVIAAAKYVAGGRYRCVIDDDRLRALKALANETKVNFSVFLISTFQLLVARLTRNSDVYIGLTVALRDSLQVATLIDNLTNTVLFRSKIQNDHTVREFIADANERFITVFSSKVYPFEQLLHELDVSVRSLGTFFINVLSDVVNHSVRTMTPGHAAEPAWSTFDLYCTIEIFRDGLVLTCDYQTRIFKPGVIAYFFEEYVKLLDLLIADPDAKIETILS